MSLGEKVTWQGVKAAAVGNSFSFRFETAAAPDHMLVDMGGDTSADTPQVDFGSGYTAAQIAQMRAEQEKARQKEEAKSCEKAEEKTEEKAAAGVQNTCSGPQRRWPPPPCWRTAVYCHGIWEEEKA